MCSTATRRLPGSTPRRCAARPLPCLRPKKERRARPIRRTKRPRSRSRQPSRTRRFASGGRKRRKSATSRRRPTAAPRPSARTAPGRKATCVRWKPDGLSAATPRASATSSTTASLRRRTPRRARKYATGATRRAQRRLNARPASAAVPPAASVSLTASSRRGSAYTTSTLRLGTELVGAPRKGVDHGIGDVVEKRLEHPRERSGHLVLERELDRAGLRRERREAPGGGEMPEGSLKEAHLHGFGRAELVPRGEGLLQAAHSDAEGGLHPLFGALVHLGRPAPGKEARVRLDVVYQSKHLLGGMLDDRGPGDSLHGKIGVKCRS